MLSHAGFARRLCTRRYHGGMRHETLAFLSGQSKGAQLQWPTVTKKNWPWWVGAGGGSACYKKECYYHIVNDHHIPSTSAYIFSTTLLVVELSKATPQRLLYWRTFSGSSSMTYFSHPGRTNVGGICCRDGGEPVRMPSVRFQGRWADARLLLMRARMPIIPCRRKAPSRAVNCRRWRRRARRAQRALNRLCGFTSAGQEVTLSCTAFSSTAVAFTMSWVSAPPASEM